MTPTQVFVDSLKISLSPLCCAIASGIPEIVQLLLDTGCSSEHAASRFVNQPGARLPRSTDGCPSRR